MTRHVCKFHFDEGTSRELVEAALAEAIRVAEDIHGPTVVRLGGGYFRLSEERLECVIDLTTQIGRHIAQVFTGILIRQCGEESFRVESGYLQSNEKALVGPPQDSGTPVRKEHV